MAGFIRIRFGTPGAPGPRGPLRVLSSILAIAGGVGILILLLPLLSVVLVVMAGAAIGLCVIATIWWLISGRKIWRRVQRDLNAQDQQGEASHRPRKRVKSHVHEDD